MIETSNYINDADARQRELDAIGWDIMQAEPSKVLERIEALMREPVNAHPR